MKFDRELGMWQLIHRKWLSISGTTPTNADVWSVTIQVGDFCLDLDTGLHRSVRVWRGNDMVWYLERNKPNCPCYRCERKRPMTSDEAAKISEYLNDPNRATRFVDIVGKLPSLSDMIIKDRYDNE